MKISAHLGHLWPDLPLLDRIHLAAEMGFDGVDIPFPYDLPAKELQRALLKTGLTLLSVAAPPPNYTGGTPGYVAAPDGEKRFDHDLRRALRFAEALRVPFVQVFTGPASAEAPSQTDARILENLRRAVHQPGAARLLLAAEADTALTEQHRAALIVAALEHARLRLLLSFSALLQTAAPLGDVLRPLLPMTDVIAIASRSGSCPATGDQEIKHLLDTLNASGYDGWLSAAYNQSGRDTGVPDWFTKHKSDL